MKAETHLDLPLDQVALLCALMGRYMQIGDRITIPTAQDVADILNSLIDELSSLSSGEEQFETYATDRGFLVYRDPDLPNSFQLCLNFGHVYYLNEEVST